MVLLPDSKNKANSTCFFFKKYVNIILLLLQGEDAVGVKLSEITEGDRITLKIKSVDKGLEMKAVLKKHVKENIAIIALEYSSKKTLVFNNVQVDLEYVQENSMPVLWSNIKVVNYSGNDYAIQATSDGNKRNRRDSFRVSVATMANMSMTGRGVQQVMIKDVSLSGFAITDRDKELGLEMGDELTVSFEDLGHILKLVGRLVRIDEHEDMIIYGFEICNLCKDLSSYVSLKQQRRKTGK